MTIISQNKLKLSQQVLTIAMLLWSPLLFISPHLAVVPLVLGALAFLPFKKNHVSKWFDHYHDLLKPTLALMIWAFLSCFWSPVPWVSLITFIKVTLLALCGLIYLFGVQTYSFDSLKILKSFQNGLNFTLILIFLNECCQFFGFDPWLALTQRSPAKAFVPVAYHIAFSVIPIWYMTPYTQSYRIKNLIKQFGNNTYALGALEVVVLLSFLWSMDSDAPWLALACVGLFLVMAYFKPNLAQLLSKPLIVLGLAFPLASFFITPSMIDKVNQHLPYISHVHRLHIAYDTINKIKESPWIGHGLNSSKATLPLREWTFNHTNHPPVLVKDQTCHPHNITLQVLLELGIIGLLLFVWTLWKALKSLKYRTRPLMLFSIIALVIDSVGVNIFHTWWISECFLMLSLYLIVVQFNIENKNKKNTN